MCYLNIKPYIWILKRPGSIIMSQSVTHVIWNCDVQLNRVHDLTVLHGGSDHIWTLVCGVGFTFIRHWQTCGQTAGNSRGISPKEEHIFSVNGASFQIPEGVVRNIIYTAFREQQFLTSLEVIINYTECLMKKSRGPFLQRNVHTCGFTCCFRKFTDPCEDCR